MRQWLFVVGRSACHLLCGGATLRSALKLYFLMKDLDITVYCSLHRVSFEIVCKDDLTSISWSDLRGTQASTAPIWLANVHGVLTIESGSGQRSPCRRRYPYFWELLPQLWLWLLPAGTTIILGVASSTVESAYNFSTSLHSSASSSQH
jgi:hypothetical protein